MTVGSSSANTISFADIVQGRNADVRVITQIEGARLMQTWMGEINQYRKSKMRDQSFKCPSESFVYAANSQSFPDIIKIGKADDIPRRLSSLNTSMPVHPYTLIASFGSFDALKSEKEAHYYFTEQRVEREFFKISESQAKIYFAQKQREHLEHKFEVKAEISLNVIKYKMFKAWVLASNERPVKRLSTRHDVIPVKRSKTSALSQGMGLLNADIWSNVAMHLKPRHLLKLMTVSKGMKSVVDSQSYWLREAVVVSWSVGALNDGCQVDLPSDVGPSRMANLAHGYNRAMNDFVSDIRQFIKNNYKAYSMNIACPDVVDKLSLSQLFELAKSVECDHIKTQAQDMSLVPKSFCQRHKCSSAPESAVAIKNRLIQRVDDIPIDRTFKQQIMRDILQYLQQHPGCSALFSSKNKGSWGEIITDESSPFYNFI